MEFEDDPTAALNGRTSLAFLQAVYCNDGLPLHVRMKAAIAALPYEHLAVTAVLNGDNDWAARMDACIARSRKVQEDRALLEAQPIEPPAASNGHAVYATASEVSAAAVRRPMPIVSYRRR